jgi:tetratricopeptide (TPR) repeat protein
MDFLSRLIWTLKAKIRLGLVMLVTLLVASCGSPDERAQSYYESGMKLLSDHSNEKAAVEFRNALRLKKDLLPAWRGLAQTEETTHNWEGLVRVLRTILEFDPNDEGTRLKLAKLLLISGELDQSLKLVREAGESNTKNGDLLALEAIIFYKLKDNGAAVREAQAALKIEHENVDALLVLAADRLANNDPKGALQLLSTSSLAQKKDLTVQLFKIKIYEQLKDYPQLQSQLVSLTEPYQQQVAFRYLLALAGFNYDQGKSEDSFRLLEFLGNRLSPTQAVMAKIMLAELNLRLQNTDAAEKIVDYVLSLDKRNVNALSLRASIRLNRGEFDPAISDLKEALNGQPFSANLALMLAIAYERSGSIESADKQFAYVTQASNFNADAGLSYAAFLRRRGRIDRASDVLTELANRWPNNIHVLATLAELKLSRQDWAGAQEIAQNIKRIGNAENIADLIVGAALSGDHKYDASIAAFQTVFAADPAAPQPMVALARALVSAKQTDRAIAFLQSVLRDNPSNAEANVLLGAIDLTKNAADQAEKNFKEAIERQPKRDVGYRALASLYVGQNKFAEALNVIRRGLKDQPDSFTLHLALAGTLEQGGDYDAAILEYEDLLRRQPGSMMIANNLASLLADHRTDKKSLEQARLLAASLRDSPVAQFKDTLGWVYYREGDLQAAVPLLEMAAASLPNVALVHYHLGMSYIGVGQLAKASKQLEEALTRAPDSRLEAKIKAGLKDIVEQ